MSFKSDLSSLSPLTTMLPAMGNVARLEEAVSSLFARHEIVESALRSEVDPAELDGLGYERAMLREVLSWLSVSPDDSEE
jgi:tellurite resistance protein